MKKYIVSILVLLFLLGVHGAGAQEEIVLIQQAGQDKTDAVLLEEGACYFSEEIYGWFKLVPLRSGTYYVYFRIAESSVEWCQVDIFDKYNQTLVRFSGETVEVELDAGQTYYVHVSCQRGDPNYFLAICSPISHAALGERALIQAPTCTEEGSSGRYCAYCGLAAEIIVQPALGHTPSEYVCIQEANCLSTGLEVIRCLECAQVLEEREIPCASHVPGTMTIERAPTCTTTGLLCQRCLVCNILLSEEMPAALGHTPGVWEDTMAATCTAEGVRNQYCQACNALLNTEVIPAHGHRAMDWQVTREAACLQSGLKEKKCSDCGVVLESEQINALGHTYTEWATITEATKDQEGEKRRHCINCGDTQFEKIEKIPKVLGIF